MSGHRLIYGDEIIPYSVCRIPTRREKIAIHVHPDGSVQVDTPANAKDREIYEAVTKRSRWIYNHLKKIKELNYFVQPRRYISGESHFYLGRRYPLKVHIGQRVQPGVKLYQGRLRVKSTKKEKEQIRELLWSWYRDRSRVVLKKRIDELSNSLVWINGNAPKIRLLEMKRQWGSCSPNGTIVLNPHLIKAPRDCVNYVILHELCHLQEHNHSKRFYRLLNQMMPEWRSIKGKLDGMANLILNI